jgi:hypothetical protein
VTHQPLDPRICCVAIDANALNRDGGDHDALVDRLLKLSSACAINLIVPQGVRREILDPRTPDHIQEDTRPLIFTTSVGLTAGERQKLCLTEAELQGNARSGRHAADARHLFEAAKYAGYFITHDQRILKRAGNLQTVLPPSLFVVTLRKFLEIYDYFVSIRRL